MSQSAAEKIFGEANHLAVGSAYVYLSEDRRVDAIVAHIVHDETLKMRSKQIAAYQNRTRHLGDALLERSGVSLVVLMDVDEAELPLR